MFCGAHTSEHVPSFWHGESAHVTGVIGVQDENGVQFVVRKQFEPQVPTVQIILY